MADSDVGRKLAQAFVGAIIAYVVMYCTLGSFVMLFTSLENKVIAMAIGAVLGFLL